jgi:hypothetical protein
VRVKLLVTTVKVTLLLGTPPTVTTTLPVVAPAGTIVAMDVALQVVKVVAAVPLKVTVLVPCDPPKFAPVIVTCAPTTPELGVTLLIVGAWENARTDEQNSIHNNAR